MSPNKKPSKTPKKEKNNEQEAVAPFPIVGVGASAGGLEAFEQFFTNLPPDTGFAFIVIQHLDPASGGILPELLQRYTNMKVIEATEGTTVEPSTVYVIPPNRNLGIEHGKLVLSEPVSTRGIRMPIDYFFRHLADNQGENAYAILLSGTGTDGTLGIRKIKERLGMVMVQDPTTAKFGGMPQSAIDTGLADFIGPAEQLPQKLVTYASHAASAATPVITDKTLTIVQQILALLRARTGHNFSGLKQNMLIRRLQRRRDILELSSLEDYYHYLQQNDPEAHLLYKELLIGVTNFFRDREAWDHLKEAIISELLRKKTSEVVRAWVIGCSTGEEAYSLAITLTEAIEEARATHIAEFQIFATDIDVDSIDVARQGVYFPNIALDISSDRLSRFFVKEENGNYRVKKDIREHIVFAVQDVVRDPPFTKLDLLLCRNLLIYFNADLQKRLMPIFHYSLNPGGILFLGTSESIGGFEDLFNEYNTKWKLFINKEKERNAEAEPYPIFRTPEIPQQIERREYIPTIKETVQQSLLDNYAPPALIVNRDGDIVYFFGKTGPYLEPAPGKASLNIYSLAREAFRMELNNAIHRAARDNAEVAINKIPVKEDGTEYYVNVKVRPLHTAVAHNLLMITFEEGMKSPVRERKKTRGKAKLSEREKALQGETTELRERLQTTIEEMETSQEEFKSTMEELQSTNEEMQSTNEELKTSREELQSLNEELLTVNTELNQKNDELARANNDLKNLLNSTDIATLFVDKKLRIMRFTPPTIKIMNLIASDIGRPVSDISSNLRYDALIDDIKEVFRTLVTQERQVPTKDGSWYQMRIIPYRSVENTIEGVVVTFHDISSQKLLEEQLQKRINVIDESGDSIVAYNLDGVISYWNNGAAAQYGWTVTEASGKNINDLLHSVYPVSFDEAKALLLDSHVWEGLIERRARDGAKIVTQCQLTLQHDEGGSPLGILEICNATKD